jgi:hypothetical protein
VHVDTLISKDPVNTLADLWRLAESVFVQDHTNVLGWLAVGKELLILRVVKQTLHAFFALKGKKRKRKDKKKRKYKNKIQEENTRKASQHAINVCKHNVRHVLLYMSAQNATLILVFVNF